MRTICLTALVVGLALTPIAAQPPSQDPPAPPGADEAKLNAVLGNWEKGMTGVQTLAAKVVRTTVDKTFQTTEVVEGIAKYMRGNGKEPSKASLELHHAKKKGVFEKYLCTGDRLFEWAAAEKVIRVHNLPPPKPGQVADDNFISFLFGMKANEARNRYVLTWLPDKEHNNKWYYYVLAEPRFPADKADFTKARLTLDARTFMPRQLWFHQPNGNEVTWDMPTVISPANIQASDFAQPQLPGGWQWQQVPREGPPRVLRNQP